MLSLLFNPSDFGGNSLSTYFSHILRGFGDKLTYWMSLFLTVKEENSKLFARILTMNKFEKKTEGYYNVERLIDDIYSIDIQSLPSVEMKFERVAKMYLGSKQVTNPEIKSLFRRNEVFSREELKKIVITMNPMYPALAHKIYRHSDAGIYHGLINKFTNIQSLSKQIQKYMEVGFLTQIKDNTVKIMKILKNRLELPDNWQNKKYFTSDCPTELSTSLRINHYGQDLIGVTKPHPLH